MSVKKKENSLSVMKKSSRVSLILIAVIIATVIASIIVSAAGSAVARRAEQKRRDEIIAGNDIRDIFAKELAFTDDDPDTNDCVPYFLTDSPNYKETGRIEVKGLMLHSIGSAFTDGKAMADYFGTSDFRYGGVHGFIDSETGILYHTLPWDQQAWHAGDGAKDYIGVEMCESTAGYYTDDYVFHPEDLKTAQRHTKTAYDAAVRLFARLCLKYEFDPMEDGRIISHSEGSHRGIATQHGDPDEYWVNVKTGYTMDGFRKDVRDYMNYGIIANLKYAPIRQILKKYIIHENA